MTEEPIPSPSHFIPVELRPPVGVDLDSEAAPAPESSLQELRRRALAAMGETERMGLDLEDEAWAPELWQSVFFRNPEVCFSVLEGEAVLLDLNTGSYYTLNPVGTAIWELLDGDRTLDGVMSALCERYGVGEDVVREDLLALLSRLRRDGLIGERR